MYILYTFFSTIIDIVESKRNFDAFRKLWCIQWLHGKQVLLSFYKSFVNGCHHYIRLISSVCVFVPNKLHELVLEELFVHIVKINIFTLVGY